MDRPISNWLRDTFLVHAAIALILGAALLLVPGRTLNLLGWVPDWVDLPASELKIPGNTFVDPVITRVMGAALLALSWSSWRAARRSLSQVSLILELEIVFCLLGALAFFLVPVLSGLGITPIQRPMPLVGWVLALLLIAFALAFGLSPDFRARSRG